MMTRGKKLCLCGHTKSDHRIRKDDTRCMRCQCVAYVVRSEANA